MVPGPDGAVARKPGTGRATGIRARPRTAHGDLSGPVVVGSGHGRPCDPEVHAVAAGVCDRHRGLFAAYVVADPTAAGPTWSGVWRADHDVVPRRCPRRVDGGDATAPTPRVDVWDVGFGWLFGGRSRAGGASVRPAHWCRNARAPLIALLPDPRTTWAAQSGTLHRPRRHPAGRPATSPGTNGSSRSAKPPQR